MSAVSIGIKSKAYKEAKRDARAEAIRIANERVREQYIDLCREVWRSIHEENESIAKISKEAGVSRTTVYSWLDEYAKLATAIPNAAPDISVSDAAGWTVDWAGRDDGIIDATDRSGDKWELGSTGEAWNKTKNLVFSGFENWPAGAKSTLDAALGAE